MNATRYLNTILTVLAVLLSLNLFTAWSSGDGMATPVMAQGIPDEGAQRVQIINELKKLNQQTGEIKSLLSSGKLRVIAKLSDSDKK